MTAETGGVKIEGRRNPFTGEEAILYVENQPKGVVAGVKKFFRWPIKLSDADVKALQKKMSDDEAKELWG